MEEPKEGRRRGGAKGKRPYVSQADIPRHTLEEALRVPRAMFDRFALNPVRPLDVAQVLQLTPSSSHFRTLTGAADAYRVTNGGPNATEIVITDLGRRIVAPTEEDDDLRAKREATLQPRVAREFLVRYDSKPLPREDIAKNVLLEMGVPRESTDRCFQVIVDNAKDVGVLKVIKGTVYIDLQGVPLEQRIISEASPVTAPSVDTAAPTAIPRVVQQPVQPARPVPVATAATPLATTPATAGDTVLRRGLQVDAYTLIDRLGTGFSAEVWSAMVGAPPIGVDIQPGQNVAIKFFYGHAMALPDQVIRVEREFRIAQRIRHPNLIRIYEFVLASSRPHHNFLVMDVAEGRPLKDLISPVGLSVQKSLQIGQQILLALNELHRENALHRDIKPGNIAVRDDTNGVHATLLDLGIVSILHERGVTAGSRFLGSKHWAPYEQLVGDPLDRRSDLYSVGAVLYHLLTGDVPYAGKPTEAAVAIEMNKRPLRLPDSVTVDISVREMINSCLSTDPAGRPATAQECLAVIERYL